jgi:hypothetical protein
MLIIYVYAALRTALQPIDKLLNDSQQVDKVRDVLRDNYLGISELFKSYSSAGSGLSTSDMDFMEWSVFMHEVKVIAILEMFLL